jgi:hypothetical protein
VLVECGFVRVTTGEGQEWTFRPSLGRVASLGSPEEIVTLYGALHGPRAAQAARYVLACLCDQDDPSPLIGCDVIDLADPGAPPRADPGVMPAAEQIVLALHLMHHGMVGKARPGAPTPAAAGQYSSRFDAAEYVSAARVHLGLSSADAEALSMTEFQQMLEMKFPELAKVKAKDVPTRDEYEAAMRRLKGTARV